MFDQMQKIVAVAFDAEWIGNRNAGLSTRGTTQARQFFECLFAGIFVKQISFKEHDLCILCNSVHHIIRAQIGRNAQICIHRPFPIRRHKNH